MSDLIFRKPKAKKVSHRSRGANHEDVEDKAGPSEEEFKEVKIRAAVPSSTLSFDQDEDDDVSGFELARTTTNNNARAIKKLKNSRNKLQASTKRTSHKAVKQEAQEDDDVVVLKESSKEQVKEEVCCLTKKKLIAVYEARKKREKLRQGGDFIPVDDTVRLKSSSNQTGERQRLVREDENDMSDEDAIDGGGKFYSAKSLLSTEEEQRQDDQANFLRIEQGDSDEEKSVNSDDDELARWEHEQIRKGVSTQKVNQYQNEINATSLYNRGHFYPSARNTYQKAEIEETFDEDMDVEIVENTLKASSIMPDKSVLGGATSVTFEAILAKIQTETSSKKQQLEALQESLVKVEIAVDDNQTSIHQLESNTPKLQTKFRLFQEMRLYVNDLLECLNEKVGEVNQLEEPVMQMWKDRSERLIKRRRVDVDDVYQKCQNLSMGKKFIHPSPEYSSRETEREARRKRRIRAREMAGNKEDNHGMITDDEETTSQTEFYRETMGTTMQNAATIFVDTADSFCDITQILNRFMDWLTVDAQSFQDAYIQLCLPKLLSPFIRLELLDWMPLENQSRPVNTHLWYQQILAVETVDSGNIVAEIIPSVVEKVLLPKIAKIVQDQWDCLSLKQSKNLASLLHSLVDDFPTVNGTSKPLLNVLSAIYHKAKASIEADTFVPLYSKEAIEAPSTGCGSFLDQQFWICVKLMRSIGCFRNLLSDSCLEELLIDGIVNRSGVLALQFSVISNPAMLPKCLALINEIPSNWLPSTNPSIYKSLAAILSRVVLEHKNKEKNLCKKLQEFADLCQKSVKKEY
uniref:GCF C-terminal domain-containing protein n=1 Tax=Ditylenchus dipsaci TaxID=166011 RepID=A0A915DJP4_9BILA